MHIMTLQQTQNNGERVWIIVVIVLESTWTHWRTQFISQIMNSDMSINAAKTSEQEEAQDGEEIHSNAEVSL